MNLFGLFLKSARAGARAETRTDIGADARADRHAETGAARGARIMARPSRADRTAVARYERMLRDASLDVIEHAHIAAFEKLTPVQLGLLFERFSAEVITASDRPADASPEALARSAAHAEAREPGTLRTVLGGKPSSRASARVDRRGRSSRPGTSGQPGTSAQPGAAGHSGRVGAAALQAGAAPAGAVATGDLLALWSCGSIFDTVATFAVAGLVWSGENFDLGGDIAGWDDWF